MSCRQRHNLHAQMKTESRLEPDSPLEFALMHVTKATIQTPLRADGLTGDVHCQFFCLNFFMARKFNLEETNENDHPRQGRTSSLCLAAKLSRAHIKPSAPPPLLFFAHYPHWWASWLKRKNHQRNGRRSTRWSQIRIMLT